MNNLDSLETLGNDVDEPQDKKDEYKKKEEEMIDEIVRTNYSPKVRSQERKPYKIGICGGHSSGKAYLKEKLVEELTNSGFKGYVITQDQFNVDAAEDQTVYKLWLKSDQSPETIPFINNKNYQTFLARAHETLDLLIDVNVIIIEGTLIFHDKSLRDKLDLKVFLSGDRDVRLSRKIYKEVCHNGKDLEKIINEYIYRLKPLYEKIIKPTEQYADLVIPRFGGEFNLNSPTNTKDALGFDNISHKILWLLVKIVKANIIGNPSNK